MQMDRMRIVRQIQKLPDFRRARHRLFRNGLVPAFSVQQMGYRLTDQVICFFKRQSSCAHRVRFFDLRHRPQRPGQLTRVRHGLRRNPELHQRGRKAVQRNIPAALTGEIHHDIRAFTGRNRQLAHRSGRGKQPLIGSDLLKIRPAPERQK